MQATSHYMNQWWLNMLTHVCITQPQWVNWMVTQLVYIGIPSNDSWGCPAGIQANPHDYVSLANCPDRSFPGLCSGHRREGANQRCAYWWCPFLSWGGLWTSIRRMLLKYFTLTLIGRRSALWLLMTWCQMGTRSSATTIWIDVSHNLPT